MNHLRSPKMKSLKIVLPLGLTFVAYFTTLNQVSSLQIYLFPQPTLPYYFHSAFSQVPPHLAQHLPHNEDLFLFIHRHKEKVTILWQDHMASTVILMRLQVPPGACSQLPLQKKFKDAHLLEQVSAQRKINQLKLSQKELESLNKILRQYQFLKKLKMIKYLPDFKGIEKEDSSLTFDQGKILKRALPFVNHLEEELSRKKIITNYPTPQTLTVSIPKQPTQFIDSKYKQLLFAVKQTTQDQKVFFEFRQKLKFAVEKGKQETQNMNTLQSNPLLTIRGEEVQRKPSKSKQQSIAVDFTKSIFYNKFHCKIESRYLSVTKICNDHSFYHLNHTRRISQQFQSIICTMESIHNHDFTMGILGKDALCQPRKCWPLDIIAYVGCVHLIVRGLQCVKVPVVFERGDELRVSVSLKEKTIRFYGNNLLIGEQRIPSEMADECYFFYETCSSGNKVLFPLPTFW